jgi:hypothetical protein
VWIVCACVWSTADGSMYGGTYKSCARVWIIGVCVRIVCVYNRCVCADRVCVYNRCVCADRVCVWGGGPDVPPTGACMAVRIWANPAISPDEGT